MLSCLVLKRIFATNMHVSNKLNLSNAFVVYKFLWIGERFGEVWECHMGLLFPLSLLPSLRLCFASFSLLLPPSRPSSFLISNFSFLISYFPRFALMAYNSWILICYEGFCVCVGERTRRPCLSRVFLTCGTKPFRTSSLQLLSPTSTSHLHLQLGTL